MEVGADRPLTIWAVSDGRAGIDNQVLGLAETLARLTPAELTAKRVAWRGWADRLPSPLKFPGLMLAPESGPFQPPWPDVWIAAGRATLPLSARIRRWSQGRTLVVQLQDPKAPAGLFDMVIPPEHDGLEGDNVFPILGSPHRVTPEKLAAAKTAFEARLGALPSPRCAVLIGGKSKSFDLPLDCAQALGAEIAAAVRQVGGSVMATFSRRTPEAAAGALRQALGGLPGEVWDGQGENPYFGYLAWADHILVTEDSTNMAVEAAATGKPVHILPLVGGARRFTHLHEALAERGVSQRFEGDLETWTYAPLNETERAAQAVLDALRIRRGF